jgi:hypothetical protein
METAWANLVQIKVDSWKVAGKNGKKSLKGRNHAMVVRALEQVRLLYCPTYIRTNANLRHQRQSILLYGLVLKSTSIGLKDRTYSTHNSQRLKSGSKDDVVLKTKKVTGGNIDVDML